MKWYRTDEHVPDTNNIQCLVLISDPEGAYDAFVFLASWHASEKWCLWDDEDLRSQVEEMKKDEEFDGPLPYVSHFSPIFVRPIGKVAITKNGKIPDYEKEAE